MCDIMRHFAEITLRRIDDLVAGSLHRQYHIGPGVAIWNGENIKRVYNLLVGPQPGQAGFNQALEGLSIDRFIS
jgi:hypothetical protein